MYPNLQVLTLYLASDQSGISSLHISNVRITIALSGGREHPNRTAKPTRPGSAMNCGHPLKRAVIRLR
jgi:hypothetical protein